MTFSSTKLIFRARPAARKKDEIGSLSRHFAPLAIAAALTIAPFTCAGASESAAGFYHGRVVNVVVGFSPGGGYDAYARLLARRLGHHIPGHPTVVVQNMPGAGSLEAVRYLNASARKDGTVITIFSPGLITQSLTTPKKVNVNFKRYAWLGSISQDIRVCYVWHTRGATRWQDLLKQKELSFGATSPGTLGYIEARIIKDYLHIPLRLVAGYAGSAQKRLGIERGELDGDCGGWVSIPQDWLTGKKINVMVRFSKALLPGLDPSVPYIGDLVTNPKRKKVLRLLIAPGQIGRPFILSRSVPAERVKALRAAFEATMKDPKFIADAKKEKLTLSPMTGGQVEKRLREIYAVSPEVVAEARRISGK